IFFSLIIKMLVGFPIYLVCNSSAGSKYKKWADEGALISHFNPNAPIFRDTERPYVLLSVMGIIAFIGMLVFLSVFYSFYLVFMVYVIPYFIATAYIIVITFLHHTDHHGVYYDNEQWSWLKGALSTVDREYGKFANFFILNIGNTHVLHHLFLKIPHYHSEVATEAIKPILGKYYQSCNRSIWVSLWETAKNCRSVRQEKESYPWW
ncbi:fatty acid desaturase, partial [Chlamydiales bacterium]|nr:fatty acid desaturase [Chlamydiales bacterium]